MRHRLRIIEDFIKKETSSGIILMFVTLLALIMANSPLQNLYQSFLDIPIGVKFASLEIEKSLLHWVSDGLMTFFFLLIGLEVKRELVEGHLSTPSQVALPIFSALGGIVAPALVYTYFNHADPTMMRGWAIPTATDIAFALGVLSLLGSRVPNSLKIFLMALAIIDDLAAIVIIALFYTAKLDTSYMTLALVSLVTLVIMNRFRISNKIAYGIVGILLWIATLKSGVHATLAGVVIGFIVPLSAKDKHGEDCSPSKEMERDLHYLVAFFVLPFFAFVNAGVSLSNISLAQFFDTTPMGIMLGLFLGKQLGVFSFSWLAIRLKLAKLPRGSNYFSLYAVSVLTGIGFTMSLFIETLAFKGFALDNPMSKLAILVGSFLSAIVGLLLLKIAVSYNETNEEIEAKD